MAYITQETKKEIHADLKKIIPNTWKWSLSIKNHTKLVLTIRKADSNLTNGMGHISNVSIHRVDEVYDFEIANIFKLIFSAINKTNYNNSDIQSDYFDVGYYTAVQIGEWNKPFQLV